MKIVQVHKIHVLCLTMFVNKPYRFTERLRCNNNPSCAVESVFQTPAI